MKQSRRTHLATLSSALATGAFQAVAIEPDFSAYSDEQKEKFLASARILSVRDIGHGVTKPVRAELEFNGVRHSGKFQVVEKELPDFFPKSGKPIPMRDSWRFNVAAYRVDRLLELRMVTVVVPRPFGGRQASLSWWVDDVMFEEVDRIKQNIEPPDREDFSRQRALAGVFDELIMNIDRNLSNLLITKSWRIGLIDHTRCFTPYHGIRNEANLTRCSRGLLSKLSSLTSASLSRAVGKHLTGVEIQALIARRDLILEFFDKASREKGAENVLFV